MDICKKDKEMLQRFLVIVILLLTITTGFSQNLGGIARGQRGYSPTPPAQQAGEPEAPDVNLLSIERANMYQELLGLDGFTKEVLKKYLQDYYAATSSIGYNPDLKFEDKRELINAERKKFEKSLKEAFSEEQVEQILTEEEFGNGEKKIDKEKRKKKRKKKKKKKNDEDDWR